MWALAGPSFCREAFAAWSLRSLVATCGRGLVEFDDDEETRAALIEAAKQTPELFDHALQSARDERARREALQAATTDHESRGYVIVDPENPEHEAYVPVRDLETTEGRYVFPTTKEMDELDGRGVHVADYWGNVRAVYYLRDPEAVGYRRQRHAQAANSGPRTEEQKAEARQVRANNKAWDSAEVVRRKFLAALVTRKALSKDAARVIASGLTTHRREVGRAVQDGSELAHSLLRVKRETGYGSDSLGKYVAATPTKAQHVALAVVLGGIEASTGRHSWRNPDAATAAYLRQLAAWGYALSEVDQIITDRDEKRRADRDAANETDAIEEDTTAPQTDTQEPELDTAAVEDGPEPIAADPADEPEPDPAAAA